MKRSRAEEAEPEAKAEVKNSGGEISCSIEETNKMRAKLGLRPLDLGPSKQAKEVENFHAKKEAEEKAKDAAAVAERVRKAKERRELYAKNDGPTLGDADDSMTSAADWVKRSRKVELTDREVDKQKAVLAAKRLQEEEDEMVAQYTSKDLSGVQVSHNASDFKEGQQVILTLADSEILAKDDRGRAIGLSDEVDLLENVHMAEMDRNRDAHKKIKRSKQPAYSGHDDAEFEDGTQAGKKAGILSYYDEEKGGPRAKFALGAEGVVIASDLKAEKERQSSAAGDKGKVFESLKVDMKEAESFYTQAEYATFNKPKPTKEKKEKKKRKKMRVKEEAEQEPEVHAVDLEAAVAASSGIAGGERKSRGSKKTKTTANAAADSSGSGRKEAYDNAVNKAGHKSSKAFAATTAAVSSSASAEYEEDTEDDVILAQSLARAARLKQDEVAALGSKVKLEKDEEDEEDKGAAWARVRVTAIKGEEEERERERESAESAMDTDMPGMPSLGGAGAVDSQGRRADGSLVFSNVTGFSSRLQAEGIALGSAAIKVEKGTTDKSTVTFDQMEVQGSVGKKAMMMEEGEEEEEAEEREARFYANNANNQVEGAFSLSEQSLAGSGMAGTLALLKETGDIDTATKERLVGRNKDQRALDPSSRDFDVKLEYRDDQGNKLTQKEAYRQLSYKFHGTGAGLNAQAKRIKQLEKETLQRSSKGGNAMQSMLDAQASQGNAFVTLSGTNKHTDQDVKNQVTKLAKELVDKERMKKEKMDSRATGTKK